MASKRKTGESQSDDGLKIALFGQAITPECLAQRNNQKFFSAAGSKKICLMARTLADCGNQVDIYSPSYAYGTHSAFSQQIAPGVSVHHAPTFGVSGKFAVARKPIATWWMSRQAAQRRTDVVISYNYHAEFVKPALVAKKKFGSRYIIEFEDGIFNERGYQSDRMLKIEADVYDQADGFILVNEGLDERIRTLNADRSPPITINGLIDPELLNQQNDSPPHPIRRIAYCGNYSAANGFDELLQYIAGLPSDIKLDVTGFAGERETRELNLISKGKNVTVHGFLTADEFANLMERVDAFLLINNQSASLNSTNFPSKLFDYLSRNRWTISTSNPQTEDYRKLGHWIEVDSIPGNFPRINELIEARTAGKNEIEELHLQTRRRLIAYVQSIVSESKNAE